MNLSLKYKIREPRIKLDKNPLILLLHGYGSNEEDLFSFAEELQITITLFQHVPLMTCNMAVLLGVL